MLQVGVGVSSTDADEEQVGVGVSGTDADVEGVIILELECEELPVGLAAMEALAEPMGEIDGETVPVGETDGEKEPTDEVEADEEKEPADVAETPAVGTTQDHKSTEPAASAGLFNPAR